MSLAPTLLHRARDFLAQRGIRGRNFDDSGGAVAHRRNRFGDVVRIGDHEDRQVAMQLARFLQELVDGFFAQVVGDDQAGGVG